MKKRIVTIFLALSMLAMMSACGNGPNNDTEKEYVFTLLDFDIYMVGGISRDLVNKDVVYIEAFNNEEEKTHFVKLNTSTGSTTKLTVSHLFEDDYNGFEIFPLEDGGYYIYARAAIENKPILKRFTADFESLYEIDLLDYLEPTYNEISNREVYVYEICGITSDGDAVVWTPEEVFTIAPNGERKQTWEYTNTRGHRTSTTALVSGNDIYRCENNITLDKIYISKLQANGDIDSYADIDGGYARVILDNGVFYFADDWASIDEDAKQTLYKLNDKGELEFLLSYSDLKSDINMLNIIALSGDRYIALISRNIYLISRNSGEAPEEKVDEREVITLATYGHNSSLIGEQVYQFNRNNADFRIEIIDYSAFEDGITKLNFEIIAGTAPDLIYWGNGKAGMVGNFNPELYSKAGVLLDLYTYIDSDDEISRNTIFPNLLKALEGANGELYEMPLSFIIQVTAGSVDIVGTRPGWTFDEYFALLEQYPEATLPFGDVNWKLFLRFALSNNYSVFIDWSKGEAYFDTAEFSRILQITKVYWNADIARILEIKRIKDGRQILSVNLLGDVSSIQKFKSLFGTEVNCIGFPTTEGVGNSFILNGSISINAKSRHADECWEFIKSMLTYDVQLNSFGFPASYEALAERLDNAAKYEEAGGGTGSIDDEGDTWSVTYTDATPEEIAQVRELIESCDRIYRDNSDMMTIIEEEAPSYFSGDKTLEEVVRIIQSRMQTYVSEQS